MWNTLGAELITMHRDTGRSYRSPILVYHLWLRWALRGRNETKSERGKILESTLGGCALHNSMNNSYQIVGWPPAWKWPLRNLTVSIQRRFYSSCWQSRCTETTCNTAWYVALWSCGSTECIGHRESLQGHHGEIDTREWYRPMTVAFYVRVEYSR